MTTGGPGTRLSPEVIVDAAITIADSKGLDALSMRRIAERLGVGTMSLYRHVADKDSLLAAMTLEVGRRFPYPTIPEAGWREKMRAAAVADWALYERHPWAILTLTSPRYNIDPHNLACFEWMLAAFEPLDVDITTAAHMTLTVWNHVQGSALTALGDVLIPARESTTEITADATPGPPWIEVALRAAEGNPQLRRIAELTKPGNAAALAGLAETRQLMLTGIDTLCDGFAARNAAS